LISVQKKLPGPPVRQEIWPSYTRVVSDKHHDEEKGGVQQGTEEL
jgi:hypothetical protein